MEIKSKKEHNTIQLSINGEIDASNCLQLDASIKAALEENIQKLQIDCRALEYISSAGLGVFVSYLNEMKSKNIQLSIVQVNDRVFQIFKILGLDKVIDIQIHAGSN
jgi:anti-sigma B factor antagonist